MYASTEAFLEDAKWILHNSMIYNGATSKYTADAKMILKICKHEVNFNVFIVYFAILVLIRTVLCLDVGN